MSRTFHIMRVMITRDESSAGSEGEPAWSRLDSVYFFFFFTKQSNQAHQNPQNGASTPAAPSPVNMLRGGSNTLAARCSISAGSSAAAVKIVPPDERACKSHWEQAACLKWATATGPSSVVRAVGIHTLTHATVHTHKHGAHSCAAQRRAPEVRC